MEGQSISPSSGAADNLIIADAAAPLGLEKLLYEEAITEEYQGAAMYKGIDVPVSIAYKTLAVALMEPPYIVIREWLDLAGEDCAELKELIKTIFDTFFTGPVTDEVTYRRVLYLGRLLQQLEAIKITGNRKALHGALQKMLKQQNLNTEDYYNYCTERYAKVLDDIPDTADKLAELKIMRKRLLNLELQTGTAYHQPLRDIRHQLVDWIRTQIALVTKELATPEQVTDRKQQADAVFKMNALVTSEVLGLFFKVILKANIFRKVPMEAFFRFATKYFSTTNNETLNDRTIRSRFHGKSLRALNEVSDMIHRMLRIVDNMKRKLKKK